MDCSKIYLIVLMVIVVTILIVTIAVIYYLFDLNPTKETFVEQCLRYHNKYRDRHKDTKPLILSHKLVESAKRRVVVMADSDTFRRTAIAETVGENEWHWKIKSESSVVKEFESLSCETPVEEWYEEKKHYIYGYALYMVTIPLTEHFTQLVWLSTREVGCAKTYNRTTIYVICHYFPKGNGFLLYPKNVMQKKYE